MYYLAREGCKIFCRIKERKKIRENIAEVEESRLKNDSTRRMGGWELGSSAGSGDRFWSGLAWLKNWDRCDGREGLDAVKGKKKKSNWNGGGGGCELVEGVAEEGKDRDTDRY